MLIIQKVENIRWKLLPIKIVINYYSDNDVSITARGSLKIGNITMQRKVEMVVEKLVKCYNSSTNPIELFNVQYNEK
jgi:hypothetical protein